MKLRRGQLSERERREKKLNPKQIALLEEVEERKRGLRRTQMQTRRSILRQLGLTLDDVYKPAD